MERVVDWVKGFALTLGGPGLFIIAFLDSSLLSFPEVVDLLLMGLVIQHKERVLYYALLSTLGSIAGLLRAVLGSRGKGARPSSAGDLPVTISIGRFACFRSTGSSPSRSPRSCRRRSRSRSSCSPPGSRVCRRSEFFARRRTRTRRPVLRRSVPGSLVRRAAIAFLKANARTVAYTLAAVVLVVGVAWIWFRRRKEAAPAALESKARRNRI